VGIGVSFISKLVRRRPLAFSSETGVEFKSHCYKRGRLVFDNRRLTVFTITLLKAQSVFQLKERTINRMKREWRFMPQFRIDFSANLRQRSDY
jgi:hypothetical protein